MFKNYLKITLRNLHKQRGYAFLNICSLAAGIACFILIVLFVRHEVSYEQFLENKDRIFRVVQERPSASGPFFWSVTSPALANTLKEEFAEVAISTTVDDIKNPLLSIDERHYSDNGIRADERFFDIFDFSFVQGDPETALDNRSGIVLTESFAKKVFGDANPIGQTFRYQNADDVVVTGVIEDPPATTHLSFAYIMSIWTLDFYQRGINLPPWYNNGWYTYVVLNEGATAAQMEAHMKQFIDTNLSNWRPEDRMTFMFESVADIHLNPLPIPDAFKPGGNIQYVYLFLAIGCIILLIACINYMNLALARSMRRAREVGMRKVIGARRAQLVGQFMGESILFALLALVIAITVVHTLLPFFGYLMERPLAMEYTTNPWLIPGLFALVVLVGLIAGSYPAFYMSGLRPIQVLKGLKVGPSRLSLQKVLIVAQYTASIILVAGSVIVFEQLQFIKNRDLGYDREHVVTIQAGDRAIGEAYDQIRAEWLANPQVLSVSYSRFLPIDIRSRQRLFNWEGSQGEQLPASTSSVEYEYLDVYGIELLTGRTFSRDRATDEDAVLVNETTIRALGWTPEEALGKQFDMSDDKSGTLRTIIGVMKDFHFNSVHDAIQPLVLTLGRNQTGYISARVRPEALPQTVDMFEKTISALTPFPFEYNFIDESFDALYKEEQRFGETFRFFTILALLIASLGLFGLAAYTAQGRTKEIGVRKVLGASAQGILLMLTSDYVKLVLIASVVAAPLAYVAMQQWLSEFAYQIQIGPGIFLFTIGVTLLIAVLSVSAQSLRAALINPVKSLRYE